MVELDYLVIGHVTRDLRDETFTIGGTASYAALTARALGCRVGIVTSASPDLNLSQILDDVWITCTPAVATTTFENAYTSAGRRQTLHSLAKTLTPEMRPADWKVKIIHLGPVARECDPALIDVLGDAFVGLTPQGWMRRWDRIGQVRNCRWEKAERWLARADAVVLSEEDVAGNESLIAQYAAQTQILVVTQGAAGCTVHTASCSRRFPSPTAKEIDSTGAGDIFAAAFFVWLQHGGTPWEAARFANCIASGSVARSGLTGVPTSDETALCKQTLELF